MAWIPPTGIACPSARLSTETLAGIVAKLGQGLCSLCAPTPSSQPSPLLLPSSPREIGKLHRRAALPHRSFAQRPRRAPGGRVVHIQVRRKAFVHALDQPVNHQKVHAAVPAQLARQLALMLPQRMLVLILEFVDRRV